MQRNRILTVVLVLLAGSAVVAFGAQRLGARALRRGGLGAGVEPAQIWRVPTHTLSQRKQLRDLQASVMGELRGARDGSGGGRPARGELMARRPEVMAEVERIVGRIAHAPHEGIDGIPIGGA